MPTGRDLIVQNTNLSTGIGVYAVDHFKSFDPSVSNVLARPTGAISIEDATVYLEVMPSTVAICITAKEHIAELENKVTSIVVDQDDESDTSVSAGC